MQHKALKTERVIKIARKLISNNSSAEDDKKRRQEEIALRRKEDEYQKDIYNAEKARNSNLLTYGNNSSSKQTTGYSFSSTTKPKYEKSKEVKESEKDLEKWENSKPGEYNSKYSDKIDSVLKEILNREDFKYSMSSDPLYEQYREMYTMNGKKAMMDTIGEASALTGGYGNSYAVTAGNQAYQQSLDQLNDVALDLRDRAFDEYKYTNEKLLSDAELLRSLDGDDYEKYLNTLKYYYKDGEYLLQKIADMSDREFEIFSKELESWESDRDFNYAVQQDALDREQIEREFNYRQQQDALDRKDSEREFNYKVQQDSLDRKEAQREFDYQKEQDALDRDEFNRQLNFNKEKEANDKKESDRKFNYQQEQDALDRDEFNRQLEFNKQKEQNDMDEFELEFNFRREEALRDQANEDRKYDLSVQKANSSGSSKSSSSSSSKSSKKETTTSFPPQSYKEFYLRTGVSSIMTESEFASSKAYMSLYEGDYNAYLKAMYEKYAK